MAEKGFQDELRREVDSALKQELSEIKNELIAMREMLVKLARVEERMIALAEKDRRVEADMMELFKRLRALETASGKSTSFVTVMERFIWIVVAAGAAWFSGRH